MVAAVDVPGGDRGPNHIGGGHRQLGGVVGPAGYALQIPGRVLVELDDLAPPGAGVVGVGGGLAVHADVAVGGLDQPVGLAGHHVGVLGQPDVEGLAAAPQGELEAAGGGGGAGGDGHRALEGGHGPPEGLDGGQAGGQAAAHQRGHGLGVGGDGRGRRHLLGGHQVGVVVDVAVDRPDHVGGVGGGVVPGAGRGDQLAVEGMGVGLGDDADRRPAGVGQHQGPGLVAGQGRGQQLVVADGGPQRGGVVAQLADLGRGLVHEARHLLGEADRAGAEIAVPAAGGDGGGHGRIAEVQAVAPHQQVQPSRVPAPDLEAVQGGQGLMDGQARGHRRLGAGVADEAPHRAGRPEAVPPQGPEAVADPDQIVVELFQLGGPGGHVAGVEAGLDLRDGLVEDGQVVLEGVGEGAVRQHQLEPGHPSEEGVGPGQPVGGPGELRSRSGAAGRIGIEADDGADHLGGGRGRPTGGPAEHGDDPAHDIHPRRSAPSARPPDRRPQAATVSPAEASPPITRPSRGVSIIGPWLTT